MEHAGWFAAREMPALAQEETTPAAPTISPLHRLVRDNAGRPETGRKKA